MTNITHWPDSIYLPTVFSQRTKDKMFKTILGASCFRRLNSTHSTGCSCKCFFKNKINKTDIIFVPSYF